MVNLFQDKTATVQPSKFVLTSDDKIHQNSSINGLYRLLKIRETKRTLLVIYLRTYNFNFDNDINENKRENKHR